MAFCSMLSDQLINLKSILDIGTGTGLIALILAHRTNAMQIVAFDIDQNSFEQASGNFDNQPFTDRLCYFHEGLDEFIEEPEDEYDLIIFYAENFKSTDESRNQARFLDEIPFEVLIEAADLL